MSDSLKFGDVIRFKFGRGEVTAMILTGHAEETVLSDEGTYLNPEDVDIYLVLGLDNTDEEEDKFHVAGQTATFILHGRDEGDGYEVLT